VRAEHWRIAGREPSLMDALNDPIVRQLARSDGLSEQEIRAAIRMARSTPGRTEAPAAA